MNDDLREPTKFLPGTPEKIAVLAARATSRIPLAQPGDNLAGNQYIITTEDAARKGLALQKDANGNLRLQPPVREKQTLTPEELKRAVARKERKRQQVRDCCRRLQARWSKMARHPNAPLTRAQQAQRAAEEAAEKLSLANSCG